MRSAIIGCGSVAAVHASCLANMEHSDIVGFADIIEERAEAFANQYGGKSFRCLEELFTKCDVEVVHICTPHCFHVPMAKQALEAGKHVYLEKPAAITLEQYEELKKAVKGAKTQLGISYQNRFNPSIQKAKEIIESGKAGKILGGRAFVSWNRSESYYTESRWRGRLETEGGGVLINQAGHTLDLLTYFLGKPVTVDAVMANHHLKGIIEVEDMMEAYICYENKDGKCYGTFYSTTAFCENRPPFIEIICENSMIQVEELNLTLLYPDGRKETPDIPKKQGLGKSYWGAGHQDCIQEFYRCIQTGIPFPLNLEGTEESNRLILEVYQSAREGKEVLCSSYKDSHPPIKESALSG